MAHRGLDGNWGWQRGLLLVPAYAFSPGRGGFQLGRLGGAGPAGAPQSLRPTHAVVSSHLRRLWPALRLDAPRSCLGRVLWYQFGPPGPRPIAPWLSPLAGIPCLPLLGGHHRGAMDTSYYGQRVLSPPVASHLSKAAVGTSGRTHHTNAAGCTGLHRANNALTSRYARMAVVVGWPFLPLQPLRATADRPRPLARSSSSQVSRPRCAAVAVGCADAAALVLRHLHSLADSE